MAAVGWNCITNLEPSAVSYCSGCTSPIPFYVVSRGRLSAMDVSMVVASSMDILTHLLCKKIISMPLGGFGWLLGPRL